MPLAETAFYRAMVLSKGTVSVLDTNGVQLTRIWCGEYVCITAMRMYVSIHACGEYVCITAMRMYVSIHACGEYLIYVVG